MTGEAMHLKRWLTGICLTPVLIYVIGFGPRWLFHLLLFLVSLQALIEFFRFASREMPKFLRWAAYGTTFVFFLSLSAGKLSLLPVVIFLWAAVPMSYLMFTYRKEDHRSTEVLGKAVLGPLYLSLPLAMLILVDRLPRGNIWIFFLLILIFTCDTAAFYVGRNFGKHRMHPLVSPGKTWEGAIGGLLASLAVAFVWSQVSTLYPFNLRMVFVAGSVSICGQIGDLTESMLKRNHGVKDSGGILPGHGGIMDRIDAHLFAIPVLFTFLEIGFVP